MAILPAAFNPFYLQVTSAPGLPLLPPNHQNTLLKIVDVLRIGINKLIYI